MSEMAPVTPPMTADEAAIEMRIVSATDWTWAIVCGVGCVAFGTGAVLGWPAGRSPLHDIGVIAALYRVFAVGMAYMAGAIAAGAVWRLVDRRPVMVATADGLRFHPSFLKAGLAWREVKWVGLKSGPHTQLGVRLKFRFWSLTYPFTASEIAIPVMTVGWSAREARARARTLRQWRQRTEPPKPPRRAPGSPRPGKRRRKRRREVL